jgi:hypothetical protein
MIAVHRIGFGCISIAILALGCSAGTGGDAASGGSGGTGGTGPGAGPGAQTATSSTAAFMTSSTSGQGGAGEVAEVFGHSADVLYRLDPVTKVVTTVAPFSGCDSAVIDIALDKDSNIYATTPSGLYHVDKTTAVCTLIQTGVYPNSLSFVPAGTLDPNVEALVGYQGDQYIRIDPVSGSVSSVGSAWNNGLFSSGDVVSVKGGKSYLTVNGSSCSDCLVEIDPKTGSMVKNWGALNFTAVYGIAFWAGSVYGFTNAGELFEVSFPNGVLMTSMINAPGATSFYGAGSTTSAPPVPTAQ